MKSTYQENSSFRNYLLFSGLNKIKYRLAFEFKPAINISIVILIII